MVNPDAPVWSAITYNGVKLKDAISALQKYARRGMLVEGLRVLVEVDAGFQEYERTTGGAKHLRTNLRNRLLIIMVEDVGVASPTLPAQIVPLLDAWKASRTEDKSRVLLAQAFAALCAARKTRLGSHLRAAFFLPPCDPAESEKYAKLSPSTAAWIRRTDPEGKCAADVVELAKQPLLRDRWPAFGLLGVLLRSKSITITDKDLWRLITEATPEGWRPAVEQLRRGITVLPSKHNEAPRFLYEALLRVVMRDRVSDEPPELTVPSEELAAMYERHTGGERVEFAFEDFVLDGKHAGPKRQDVDKFWVEQAALIRNEALECVVPDFHNVYLRKHGVTPVYGHMRCAWHKKLVQVLTTLVMKGPYLLTKADERKRPPPPRPSLLLKHIANSERILVLDDARDLPASVHDVVVVEDSLGQEFLIMPSLVCGPIETEVRSTNVDQDMTVLLQTSRCVVRVADLTADELSANDFALIDGALNHLYARLLTTTGDSHFGNILVNYSGEAPFVVGIDLEETRGLKNLSCDPLTLLMKRPDILDASVLELCNQRLGFIQTFRGDEDALLPEEARRARAWIAARARADAQPCDSAAAIRARIRSKELWGGAAGADVAMSDAAPYV